MIFRSRSINGDRARAVSGSAKRICSTSFCLLREKQSMSGSFRQSERSLTRTHRSLSLLNPHACWVSGVAAVLSCRQVRRPRISFVGRIRAFLNCILFEPSFSRPKPVRTGAESNARYEHAEFINSAGEDRLLPGIAFITHELDQRKFRATVNRRLHKNFTNAVRAEFLPRCVFTATVPPCSVWAWSSAAFGPSP